MDKIIRIHIARVPYSIEHRAEADFKKYLEDIRAGLAADTAGDVMEDIELRITELLAERGVKADGVITAEDVQAVEQQLGRPEQVTDADSEAKNAAADTQTSTGGKSKRLLRDMDTALLGGVASGIGAYFGIDTNIVRIVFIVLAFWGGFGILLYLLLWGLLPAATTSADHLDMQGEPVTVASLQRYRAIARRTFARPRVVRHFLATVFRMFWVMATVFLSLTYVTLLALATGILATQPFRPLFTEYRLNYVLLALLWLAVASMVGLLGTLARWVRQGKATRTLKRGIVICAVGFAASLIACAALTPAAVSHYQAKYGDGKLTRALTISETTPNVTTTTLHVTAGQDLVVEYIASPQPLHATYQEYPGMGKPDVMLTSQNGTLTIAASHISRIVPNCPFNLCHDWYLPLHISVYGPAPSEVIADGGSTITLDNLMNGALALHASNGSSINLDGSNLAEFSDFSATADTAGLITAFNASAQKVDVSIQADGQVDAPATNALTATLPADCSNTSPLLNMQQFPASMTVNGQPSTPGANNCIAAR